MSTANQEIPQTRLSRAGLLAALWGIGGIVLLLLQALWRLTPLALEPLQTGQLSLAQGILYAAWTVCNAYAEGYRGFQKGFAPRCASRAVALAQHPTLLRVLLAPAYCMALFDAPRRRLIVSWVLVLGITALILLVRSVPQPWRGIIDAGVVAGLGWGLVALLASSFSAFRSVRARGEVQGKESESNALSETLRESV